MSIVEEEFLPSNRNTLHCIIICYNIPEVFTLDASIPYSQNLK